MQKIVIPDTIKAPFRGNPLRLVYIPKEYIPGKNTNPFRKGGSNEKIIV